MPGSVLKRLHSGKLGPDDLLIAPNLEQSMSHLWDRPSSMFLLREVPNGGDEHYECPACGGHAPLGTTYLMCRCGCVVPVQIQPNGIFADLVEALRRNVKQERWFINRPWNSARPWMSRDSIKAALGLNKEQ